LSAPYEYNGRFKVTAFPKQCWDRLRGDISFTPIEGDPSINNEYRSVAGPIFSSKTNMYKCDNDGIVGCVRRLTSKRKPDIPLLHERLKTNQMLFRRNYGSEIQSWSSEFSRRLRAVVLDRGDSEELRNIWTDAPHIKKKLRVRSRNSIIMDGRDKHPTRVGEVEYKPKPGELLADGKYLRGIGDLTTPGSTKLGYYMDFVKEVFAQPYVVNGMTSVFIKEPNENLLEYAFSNLMETDDLFFTYFSDDSCVGVRCNDGKTYCWNMDISACDGSNYDPVFHALRDAIDVDPRFSHDVAGAFKQLKMKCVVRSANRREKLYFKPRGHVLYSGSVLTTSVNNMANTLIFLCITKLMPRVSDRTPEVVGRILQLAAEQAGYLVRSDLCTCDEDLQFLKYSPTYVNGRVTTWLNLGPWLRGYGMCKGEFPGGKRDGDKYHRARLYNSEIVRGRVHCGNHLIHDAFKTHIVEQRIDIKNVDRHDRLESRNARINTEFIARRYKVEPWRLEELALQIRDARVGDRVCNPILDIIFDKDYGY